MVENASSFSWPTFLTAIVAIVGYIVTALIARYNIRENRKISAELAKQSETHQLRTLSYDKRVRIYEKILDTIQIMESILYEDIGDEFENEQGVTFLPAPIEQLISFDGYKSAASTYDSFYGKNYSAIQLHASGNVKNVLGALSSSLSEPQILYESGDLDDVELARSIKNIFKNLTRVKQELLRDEIFIP